MNWRWLRIITVLFSLLVPLGSAEAAGRARKATPRPGQELYQGREAVQKMQESLRRAQRRRDEAKARKDQLKLNCLNDKLSKASAHVRDAEQSLGALGEALSAGDRAEQSFELARIRIYQQKVATLMADADACAGDDGGVLGQNRTDVEIDPTIPKGDPTDPGLPSPTSAMAPPGIEEAATDSPSSNPLMP